jgi:thiamine-monophosphate kinase
MNEFELIARYFSRPCSDASVLLGVGDDCAALQVPAGERLLVSTDLLVEGRHFPESTAAFDVGYKAMAVNLSDLAAMGARPLGVTLGLALPSIEPDWLAAFAQGFYALAEQHGFCLVGGDTVKSPVLSLAVTIMGSAQPDRVLKRSGAQPGDLIAVTGTLGDAGLGLRSIQYPESVPASLTSEDIALLQLRLNRPTPRVEEGRRLAEVAHAALDVSDGLLQDLGHLLRASNVGAVIEMERLPRSSAARSWIAADPTQRDLPLTAGDDYELLFAIPPDQWATLGISATVIGRITEDRRLRVLDAQGRDVAVATQGFDHFVSSERR